MMYIIRLVVHTETNKRLGDKCTFVIRCGKLEKKTPILESLLNSTAQIGKSVCKREGDLWINYR